MRYRRILLGTVTVAAVGGVGLAVHPGPATGASPGLPVLATGTITFPLGSDTGQVLAFADPNQVTLKRTASGDTLDLRLVSSANAATDGSFTLTLDPAQVPTNADMPDGSINMEVIAVSGGLQQVYFFPVKLVGTGTSARFVSSANAADPATARLSFDMRGGSATNVRYAAGKWLSESGRLPSASQTERLTSADTTMPVKPSTASIAADVAADTTPAAICLLHAGDYITRKPEHFVNVYTDNNHTAMAHVTESATASHTLGVAVDFGGTWHQSGTANISNTESVSSTSRDRQKAWSYWNKVNYRKFFDSCMGRYQKPASFYDILSGDLDGRVDMLWLNVSCGVKRKGDSWDTGSARAATFGAGVDLPVVDVSAQTGFGTSENVHFTFLRKGEVVGNATDGPVHSSVVEVDKFYGSCPR